MGKEHAQSHRADEWQSWVYHICPNPKPMNVQGAWLNIKILILNNIDLNVIFKKEKI